MRAASALFAIALFAGLQAAAEPKSPAHEQAALELFRVMNIERTMLGGASAMAETMIRQNVTLTPYRDVIIDWAQSVLTWDNFVPKLVDLYTEAFSEAELRDMIAFYKTATGQRLLEAQPSIMQRSALLGAEVAQGHVQELQERVRKRAAELAETQKKQ